MTRYKPVRELKIHQTCTLSVGLVLRIEELMEELKESNKSRLIESLLETGLLHYDGKNLLSD